MLKDDHAAVETLFQRCEKADEGGRGEIVQRICAMLTQHAQLEEEIFYPELREALGEDETDDLLDEAEVEHGSIKALIAELSEGSEDDHLYQARVTVLREYVKHHVKEEEEEIFPKARSAELDLDEMGERLRMRKEQLGGGEGEAGEESESSASQTGRDDGRMGSMAGGMQRVRPQASGRRR